MKRQILDSMRKILKMMKAKKCPFNIQLVNQEKLRKRKKMERTTLE
jgi:hypothetical protein